MPGGLTISDAPPHEREHELAAFDEVLRAAAPRLVLVEGPAGIGKSRLVDELAARCEPAGVRALSARGAHLEREFPFGVVRQLFEAGLTAPAERERLLAGAAASAAPVFDAFVVPGPGASEIGAYPNFVEAQRPDASGFFDAASWRRLREIKALYDPGDLFKANHGIPPASYPATASQRS